MDGRVHLQARQNEMLIINLFWWTPVERQINAGQYISINIPSSSVSFTVNGLFARICCLSGELGPTRRRQTFPAVCPDGSPEALSITGASEREESDRGEGEKCPPPPPTPPPSSHQCLYIQRGSASAQPRAIDRAVCPRRRVICREEPNFHATDSICLQSVCVFGYQF